MPYVVNSTKDAVTVDIVNRKNNLLRTETIQGNDYIRIQKGEYYRTTYQDYSEGSPPRIGLVLCDGTNYFLIS